MIKSTRELLVRALIFLRVIDIRNYQDIKYVNDRRYGRSKYNKRTNILYLNSGLLQPTTHSTLTLNRGGSRIFSKGGGSILGLRLQAKKGGPVLGPMLKTLHRGPKGGGGVRTSCPPGSAHAK